MALQKYTSGTMDLLMRDITFQDSEILLEWRNQREVRMFSRNQGLIPKETHEQWLQNRLKLLLDEPFWMFENSLGKIGFVRCDLQPASKQIEVSIVINPAFRGMGFGKIVLNLAIESCLVRHPESIFIAEAHTDNLSSKMLFLKCGFEEFTLNGDFLTYKRIANLN